MFWYPAIIATDSSDACQNILTLHSTFKSVQFCIVDCRLLFVSSSSTASYPAAAQANKEQ